MENFELHKECLKHHPSLQIFTSNDIHSKKKGYRLRLREELVTKIGDDNGFLNLKKRPAHDNYYISISHCKIMSGFAITDSSLDVGFDIEEKSRIRDELIDRISKPEERKLLQNTHLLWPAKEACWKVLNPYFKVPTISHIDTMDWQKLNKNWSRFNVAYGGQLMDGGGFVFENSDIYLSFYLLTSTFVEKHRQR